MLKVFVQFCFVCFFLISENRVNECFPAQSHQLQCKTVNIPDQRINILTKHTEDSSYDKYFENCQRFVNEFEKNIIQKCREQLFRRCVINRFAYSGDNCYEHLERVPQVMNIKYSCTGTYNIQFAIIIFCYIFKCQLITWISHFFLLILNMGLRSI